MISDTLRDTSGNVYRLYPTPQGEATIDEDIWGDAWTNASYTVPTNQRLTYRTLKDTSGITWYLYTDNQELLIDDTQPTPQAGVWSDPIYWEQTVTEGTTIHYLSLEDENGNSWYLYPTTGGELFITETQPS